MWWARCHGPSGRQFLTRPACGPRLPSSSSGRGLRAAEGRRPPPRLSGSACRAARWRPTQPVQVFVAAAERGQVDGDRTRTLVIALARVNSRSPSAPWIRPNPESPTPPNGSAGTPANPITELIDGHPAAQRARPPPWRRVLANTAAPSAVAAGVGQRDALVQVRHLVTVTSGRTSPRAPPTLPRARRPASPGRTYGAPDASHAADHRAAAPGQRVGDVPRRRRPGPGSVIGPYALAVVPGPQRPASGRPISRGTCGTPRSAT